MQMISKKKLSCITKILPKKAFSPIFQDLLYFKETNCFVATDSFMLYEIQNPFDAFNFDFTINWEHLRRIKENINLIEIKDNVATIITKDNSFLCKITTDQNLPQNYRSVFMDKSNNKIENTLQISQNYSKFFEICTILTIPETEIKDNVFVWKDDHDYVVCRIQQKY